MAKKDEDETPEKPVNRGFIPEPVIWWPLIVGVFLMLVAIAAEHGIWVAEGEPTHGTEAKIESPKSVVFNTEIPIILISEVGYALLIAWVVSIAIEAASRREHNKAVKESRDAISRDVFEGVYGIRHDPNYVRTVIATCLEETMMRENYSVNYKVEPLPQHVAICAGDKSSSFVYVTVTIRYDIRNVGSSSESYKSTYGIPVREGVLEEHAKVTLIKIGTDSFEDSRLEKLGKRSDDGDLDYEFNVDLDPRESKEVLIEAVIIKDLSDADTFGFRRPTTGATIRLDVNLPDFVFGASERTSSPMKVIRAPTPGRTAEWRIDGPILPFNSVVLWWRPRAPVSPPEGAVPSEQMTTPAEALNSAALDRRIV